MRVLLTGAAGFIGCHLVDHFIEKGFHVIGLDNLSQGSLENIKHLEDNKQFKFVQGDICDQELLDKLVSQVDVINHHAALGSVPKSIDDPLVYIKNNLDGFAYLLEAARKYKIKKIVFASSSSVYGDNLNSPKSENDIGNLLSPYAATKLMDEILSQVYSQCYGLKIIALRYFNVFGPKQNPHSLYAAVIPKWADLIRRGESPSIYGDGSITRDFTYIDNVCHANYLVTNKDNSKKFEVYNVGCGYTLNLTSLAKLMIEAFNQKLEPKYANPRAGDILHSLADISKIKKDFQFEPLTNVEEGLKKYAHWYLKS